MSKYNLAALGNEEFEHVCQSLVQQIIGPGAKVYGMGSDGAREATFHGKAAYPSSEEQWDGSWIFQVKFHNIQQIGPKEARRCLLADLDDELSKITVKFKHQCDNFILMTNVALTPVFQKGTKDRIDNKIIPKYKHLVKNIHVWGADEICRFLDAYPNIRQTYAHLIVTGDIIARLLNLIERERTDLDELIKLYCQGCFDHEQYAALDDAGDIEDERIKLQHLFIDLDVDTQSLPKDSQILDRLPEWLKEACETDDVNLENERTSALSFFLDDTIPGLVLIGGPGEGKSTLGQYLVQIYRSRIIGKLNEVTKDVEEFEKCIPRVPFRIFLREYAQWMASQKESDSLFHYLAEKVSRDSGKNTNSEAIHDIMKSDPSILILDGLDEVPEKRLRTEVIDNITSFVNQVRNVLQGDLRVIATTRPYGYSKEFASSNHLHLTLKKLSSENAALYANLWTDAREPNTRETERIKAIFSMCLSDMVVKVLTQTPLQVTILLVIIRARGTPPKQREELFERYMDIIYQREQKKRPELLRTEPDIIYGLHKYLAYILHRRVENDKTEAVIDVSEFKEKVKDYLIHCNPLLNDLELENKLAQIIAEVSQRLVLIESPQEDKVGFGLTTTREFFTAAHLVDTARDTKERDARFRAIAKSSHWRNVALFFAGRVGRTRPGEAPSMVDVCREIDTEKVDKHIKRGAALVLEMVDDKVLREPHNEIGAIQYGLNLFESDYVKNSDEYVNRLLSLPNEYKERIIRPWLEENLSSALPDNLMIYSNIYEKLFGINDILCDAIKKVAESSSTSTKLWALSNAVRCKIDEYWVVELFGELIELISINKISYALREYWMNLVIYSDFSISAKVNAAIAKLLLSGHVYRGHTSMDEIIITKGADKLNGNRLLWGMSTLISLFSESTNARFEDVHGDINLSIPKIASPEIKKLIKKHSNLIRDFCEAYSKEKEPFINFLVNVFEFVLAPQNIEKYIDILKKTQMIDDSALWRIRNVISLPRIIPKDEEEIRKYHNTLITFIKYYKSQEQYISDQREFIKLINKESDKVKIHPFKLLAWIMNIGNDSIIEDFLDEKILNELKEWMQYRGLQKNSILLSSCTVRADLELMNINIKLIADQLRNKEEEIDVGFTLDWYEWQDEKTKQEALLANRFKSIIAEIILNHNILTFREDSSFEQLYWTALSINVIDEKEMLALYKIFRKNSDFPSRGPWELSANSYSFLEKMLQSNKIEVVRLAAVSLSEFLKLRSYRHADYRGRIIEEQFIPEKLWQLARSKKDIWRSKYIEGMAHCKLKWSLNYKKWNASIKEVTTEDITNAWCLVIKKSDYHQTKDQEAFFNLICNILESGDMYPNPIRIVALKRLHDLIAGIETGRFNEEPLNLPLSRRARPLFP